MTRENRFGVVSWALVLAAVLGLGGMLSLPDLVEGQSGIDDACTEDFECGPACGRCVSGQCEVASAGSPCLQRIRVDCQESAETCDGVSPACPIGPAPAGTICRSEEACGKEATCTGTSTVCPPGELKPATTECRSSSGVCDVAENCTGTSPDCPPDAVKPVGTECRAAAGTCDTAEVCDGAGGACPPEEVTACTASPFKCYEIKPTLYAPEGNVEVDDELYTLLRWEAQRPWNLCAPAAIGTEPVAPEVLAGTHLEGYSTKLTPTNPPQTPPPPVRVKITDQFGTVTADTDKAFRMLVPTNKSRTGYPPVPSDLNNYMCYTLKLTQPFTQITGIRLTDQFTDHKVYDLAKPYNLCVPASVEGSCW